jgi:hypothetical protein
MQQVARPDRASARRATVDGPLYLSAGGYAYGLRASETCRFRLSVAHSGGLPGFGSQMRWLPEQGVGLVALSNLTYGAPSLAISDALQALARTGALQPRVAQPAGALVAAREGVDRLVAAWDDALYERLAADNLSLDRPKEKRRKELEDLRAAHGTCRPDGPLVAENALRGEWELGCERGRLRLALTLAPTEHPRIQDLRATSVLPLSPALQAAAAKVAARVGEGGPVQDLLAEDVDPALVARAVAAAAAWGSCRVGPVRQGGGDAATVRFSCDKGQLEARLAVDVPSGRLSSIALAPDPDEVCVP